MPVNVRWRLLQPIRFVLVGGVNTVVGVSTIFLLKWIGVGDYVANACGYCIGLVTSHLLNSRWTFNYTGPWRRSVPRVVAVFAAAYVANLVTLTAAIRLFDVNSYVAQISGVITYMGINYLGLKHYAYRHDQ